VHVAAVAEQRIRRRAELEVAQAALNDALGLPLDAEHTLSTTLVGRDGKVIKFYPGNEWTPDEVVGDVKQSLGT